MPFFSALGSLWDRLRPNRPNRPPTGQSVSREDGDGPEPASSTSEHEVFAGLRGRLVDFVKAMGSCFAEVRSRIESVGAGPSDRVDELRAQLYILSTACLSFAPVLVVLMALENLHGASYTVVACLLVICVLSGFGGFLFCLAPRFRCEVTQPQYECCFCVALGTTTRPILALSSSHGTGKLNAFDSINLTKSTSIDFDIINRLHQVDHNIIGASSLEVQENRNHIIYCTKSAQLSLLSSSLPFLDCGSCQASLSRLQTTPSLSQGYNASPFVLLAAFIRTGFINAQSRFGPASLQQHLTIARAFLSSIWRCLTLSAPSWP
ncbi:hypothetical protein CCMA1212_003512 [Trichoderma ghanense]|uniref:Uncharacterized protein n=1 Tax=Trichoderma ghanense TaxID=65468 RepID=A0ABY2HAG0_9HYPO